MKYIESAKSQRQKVDETPHGLEGREKSLLHGYRVTLGGDEEVVELE